MILIEPLDERHKSTRFRSGATFLDEYLRGEGLKDQQNDLARTFVAVETEEDPEVVIGFFTLRVIGQYIPAIPETSDASDLWLHPAELAYLARDQSWRGTGLGAVLLVEAMRHVADASRNIGLPGIFLYSTREGSRLYEAYGFQKIPDQNAYYLPLRNLRAIVEVTNQD